MSGDMGFTAANRSDHLARESTLATQRRHDGGLVLRDAPGQRSPIRTTSTTRPS